MTKTKREYIGLDLETSGSRHDIHVPIQLGIAMPNGEMFRSDIGGWDFYDPTDEAQFPAYAYPQYLEKGYKAWSQEAFGIHGITQERLAAAPDRFAVQTKAAKFIGKNTDAWIGNRLVVGWNVASFDMPFVREYLPAVSNSLSYRSVDLNAVTFATAEALGLSVKRLKGQSKEWAARRMEHEYGTVAWHDAGFDAEAALHSLDYLKQVIKTGDLQ